MISWKGQSWRPQEFAICMAFDAFRIALGGKPRSFTADEVLVWLRVRRERLS